MHAAAPPPAVQASALAHVPEHATPSRLQCFPVQSGFVLQLVPRDAVLLQQTPHWVDMLGSQDLAASVEQWPHWLGPVQAAPPTGQTPLPPQVARMLELAVQPIAALFEQVPHCELAVQLARLLAHRPPQSSALVHAVLVKAQVPPQSSATAQAAPLTEQTAATPQREAVVAVVQLTPALFEQCPHTALDVQVPAPAQVPPPQVVRTFPAVQPVVALFEHSPQVAFEVQA